MERREFLRQIRDYEAADDSALNKAYKILITTYRTHPFPILRAKKLDAWPSSPDDLGESLVGKSSQDVDASALHVGFFEEHPMP